MATIRLPPDFKEFLRLLNSNDVVDLIHLEDLKRNKQASGRLKDQVDLQQLP
jgi:hypothetical protein